MKNKIFTIAILSSLFFGGIAFGETGAVVSQKVDIICVQNAVEKRESAIIVSLTKKIEAQKIALENRKSGLKSAWEKPTPKERAVLVKEVWAKFKLENRKINSDFKKEQKEAWTNFHKERKSCKPSYQDSNSIYLESAGEKEQI